MVDSHNQMPHKEIQASENNKSANDDFIDRCLDIDFSQKPDDRIWSDMEGLKHVPSLVRENRLEEAWQCLNKYQIKLSDFDFIYAWQALILQKNGRVEDARALLKKGMKHARKKYLLFARFGHLEYETGHMQTAVKWWIKSILAMKQMDAYIMWEPFLYLAYTAKFCGSDTHFNTLINKASAISGQGDIRLEQGAVEHLEKKTALISSETVAYTIEQLVFHINEKPESGSQKPDIAIENKPIKIPPPIPPGKAKKRVFTLMMILFVFIWILLFYWINSPPENKEETHRIVPRQTQSNIVEHARQPVPEKPPSDQNIKTEKTGKTPPKNPAAPDNKEITHKKRLENLKTKSKKPKSNIQKKTPDNA